jgi:hypothetical protein
MVKILMVIGIVVIGLGFMCLIEKVVTALIFRRILKKSLR